MFSADLIQVNKRIDKINVDPEYRDKIAKITDELASHKSLINDNWLSLDGLKEEQSNHEARIVKLETQKPPEIAPGDYVTKTDLIHFEVQISDDFIALEQQVQEMELERIKPLELRVTGHNARISGLETRLDGLPAINEQINQITEDLMKLEAKIEKLLKELINSTTTIKDISREIEDIKRNGDK